MIIEGLLGTLFGFLGTGLTTFSNYKMEKLKIGADKDRREHELAMVRAESEARIAEVQAEIQVTAVATEGAVLLEEARAFTASQVQGNQSTFETKWMAYLLGRKDGWRFVTIPLAAILCFLFGVSDAVKDSMRSALTLYAVFLATWVTWQSWAVLEAAGLSAVSTAQALEVFDLAMRTALTLSVTIITWWFGDKRVAKHLMHMAEKRDI